MVTLTMLNFIRLRTYKQEVRKIAHRQGGNGIATLLEPLTMQWIEEGLAGQPVTSDQVPTLPLCFGCPRNTTTVTDHSTTT